MRISIPPKILEAFITTSLSILAFLKSSFKPPKIAVKSAPLKSSLFKSIFWPEKAAK